MTTKIYVIYLHILRLDYQHRALSSVLTIHDEAIASVRAILAEHRTHENGDYFDAVADDQSEIIEDLLGCSFVAAQAYITNVVSNVKHLHERAAKDGITLSTTDSTKSQIMAKCSPIIAGTTISKVRAINAFANYYKHHDEWEHDWSRATGLSASMIADLIPLGLSSESTGNLITGLTLIGGNLLSIADILREWRFKLCDAYEGELRDLNLL